MQTLPKAKPGAYATCRALLRNSNGLHLRSASLLSEAANRFTSQITIRHDAVAADAKSILGLLTLLAPYGTELTIEAVGPDADSAVVALASLISLRVKADRAASPSPG
ncbi:MAG TPA: HPr family phosphocarrier protein [Pirellulales bacterium]|nr:HPr family phosphocarrier protein [Pirellulales bacterium]